MTSAGHSGCTLASLIPNHPDIEERKRDAWNALNILVVRPDDHRLSAIEKEIVRQIGDKLFGGKMLRGA